MNSEDIMSTATQTLHPPPPPMDPQQLSSSETAALPNTAQDVVESTYCSYALREEIGKGAYGKVFVADVLHNRPPQPGFDALGDGTPPSRHRGGGRRFPNQLTTPLVLKVMENISVEDGVQAATLREIMVQHEVAHGNATRHRSELEAFQRGRAPFVPSSSSTITRNESTFSFLDYGASTNSADERWDDGSLCLPSSQPAAQATHGSSGADAAEYHRRIAHGRDYLVGLLDSILRPKDHLAYVAMEYCEGGDLWRFIRDTNKAQKESGLRFGEVMTPAVYRRWAVEMILALAFLHAHNISHRDLKPQNLMLARRSGIPDGVTFSFSSSSDSEPTIFAGEQYTLKVGDFGLSRLEDIPYKKYVHEAVTLWYRSPDVLLGNMNYTYSADAWSLGCILIEMASGHAIFRGRGEADQIKQIFGRIGRPSLGNFSRLFDYPLSDRYAEVLQACCDGAPEATSPETAREMLAAHVEGITRRLRRYFEDRLCLHLVGEEGLDMIARLLIFDPEKRLSIREAVQHPFFKAAYLHVFATVSPS